MLRVIIVALFCMAVVTADAWSEEITIDAPVTITIERSGEVTIEQETPELLPRYTGPEYPSVYQTAVATVEAIAASKGVTPEQWCAKWPKDWVCAQAGIKTQLPQARETSFFPRERHYLTNAECAALPLNVKCNN